MAVKDQVITDRYALYLGDCCEVLQDLPDGSVDFSVFSPPFSDLYNYSSDDRDMSNCTTYEQFFEHFDFLVEQLQRLIKPGRLVAVHCMDLKKTSTELVDFPGDIIRNFAKRGFRYHSRFVIWKEPLRVFIRTRSLGLAHKQIVKDSSLSKVAQPDYVLVFRAKGKNQTPIAHPLGLLEYAGEREPPPELVRRFSGHKNARTNKLSHWIWQQYASPFWDDIRIGRVLPYREAKEPDDERHVCLARGSLVLTYDGYKPIEDVVIGDRTLTHLGRWCPVIAKACMGEKSVVRVKAQGVADLRVTPDHKLWARYVGAVTHPRKKALSVTPTWIAAEETKASYVNLKLPPIEDTEYSLQEWWIVGRWLADGHFDGRDSVHISCGKHKFTELIERLGDRAGFVHDTGTSLQVRIKDPAGNLRKILNRCGRGAANKKVPGEALSLNSEYAESLLSGYLSGDGHLVPSIERWSASSVSRALLLGMAMIAQRARNTVASVYAGKPAGESIIEGRIVNCLDGWIFGLSPRNKSGIMLEDGAWKKVREVADAGKAEVWDIQVAEDASFTAEGCIVKNCPLQLDVIERCLTLWSNPDDTVLTPFMGVGSEVYGAVQMGRKAIGVELKRSYWKQAVRNVRSVVESKAPPKELFEE